MFIVIIFRFIKIGCLGVIYLIVVIFNFKFNEKILRYLWFSYFSEKEY